MVSLAYQHKFLNVGHGNKQNRVKIVFDDNEGSNENIVCFFKLFMTTVVSVYTKSYTHLKLYNLVIMATNKIVSK